MLKAVSASTAVAVFAGCLGDDDDGADEEENGDDDAGGDGIEIEPGTTIMLEGITGGWEGLEPEEIEGETNPTLLLQEGETYEIGWEQGDGSQHNVEIWDADEEVVDDYETELTDEPGDPLEFTASDEMAYYRCDPHPNMQGEIQVE